MVSAVVFWLLVVLMVVGAVSCVVVPLILHTARDPSARARRVVHLAHDAGVLNDREVKDKLAQLPNAASAPTRSGALAAIATVLTIALPVAAFLLYFGLGAPNALLPAKGGTTQIAAATPDAARAGAPDADGAGKNGLDMNQAVAGLAERLKSNPDNVDGWMLLGRAYKTMERFDPAREALAQALRLAPNEPQVMLEYAEALALSSASHRIEGEALNLIERVLSVDPTHQNALWLRGTAAMQQGLPKDASAYWERLLAQLPADAQPRAALVAQIEEARASAGLPALAPVSVPASSNVQPEGAATPDAPTVAVSAAGGSVRLTVRVDISEALRQRPQASDVLFVFARSPSGPKMPLAIQRIPAASLPTTVTLDDSHSMLPTMKLSMMTEVVVGARISRSGQAAPQAGDLQTFSAPLSTTRRDPIDLLIDEVVQ